MINLDECESIGTNWIVVYPNGDNVTNFQAEYIPKEIKKSIGNKNITTYIFIGHNRTIQ